MKKTMMTSIFLLTSISSALALPGDVIFTNRVSPNGDQIKYRLSFVNPVTVSPFTTCALQGLTTTLPRIAIPSTGFAIIQAQDCSFNNFLVFTNAGTINYNPNLTYNVSCVLNQFGSAFCS